MKNTSSQTTIFGYLEQHPMIMIVIGIIGISLLFLKGKLSGRSLLAIAITLAGSMLIAWSDSSSGGNHLYGDILSLPAAIAAAVYTLIGRIARSTASTTIYTYLVYLTSAVTLVIITFTHGYTLTGYGASGIIVGLLLEIFSTILATVFSAGV